MAKPTENGQIVIELAIVAVLMVGLFLLAVSITEAGNVAQNRYRFTHSRNSR